jgi:hypothetical protein
MSETAAQIEAIAELLFAAGPQSMVPFLGAGVSLSARSASSAATPSESFPDRVKVDAVLDQLGLSGSARSFLEVAIFLAGLVAARQGEPELGAVELVSRLGASDSPPSAGELADAFCRLAQHTSYEGVARQVLASLPTGLSPVTPEELVAALRAISRVTGIANPPDALTSITAYYETKRDRSQLWQRLRDIFSNAKRAATPTHELLADAARASLEDTKSVSFLIITTNYDCLMEQALDVREVPYVVLTTVRGTSRVEVAARFSRHVVGEADLPQLIEDHRGMSPKNFTLSIPGQPRVVVLYKIHGCLSPLVTENEDAVVISDTDYVNYISQMSSSDGAVPAQVTSLLSRKRLLFLGYSLNDWNVRSIFQTVRRHRGERLGNRRRDYSVMRTVREYERLFFERQDVQIVETDLNAFVAGVQDWRSRASVTS